MRCWPTGWGQVRKLLLGTGLVDLVIVILAAPMPISAVVDFVRTLRRSTCPAEPPGAILLLLYRVAASPVRNVKRQSSGLGAEGTSQLSTRAAQS